MKKIEIFGWLLFIISSCLSAIIVFIIPIFQSILFSKNAFAISSKSFYLSLSVYTLLIFLLFLYIYLSRKNYKLMKIFKSLNYFNIKRILIFGIISILLIVYTIFALANYIRIDQNGIYQKTVGFKNEFISWNDIQTIKIDTVTRGYYTFRMYNRSINPRLLIISNNRIIDIWQFNSPGRLKYDEIKYIINYIKNYTTINIVYDVNITDRELSILGRRRNGEIIKVFDLVN
jgi:hypothetical protein